MFKGFNVIGFIIASVCGLLPANSMETYGYNKNYHQSLDQHWKHGTPRLSEVIGMPVQYFSKENQSDDNRVGVAIVDDYLNPKVIDFTLLANNQVPNDYDFLTNDHGTHVASTVKKISPAANIYQAPWMSQSLEDAIRAAAENEKVDVINLSCGPKYLPVIDEWLDNGKIYTAIQRAINNGKIVIHAFGNQFHLSSILGGEPLKNYCELLMATAEHQQMKGRLIHVVNADCSTGDELLGYYSNRPHRQCDYVITAPGTNITACVGKGIYATKSGTSMSAPIVSGIIAQLIFDFKGKLSELGLNSRQELRDLVLQAVLIEARQKYTPNHNGSYDVSYGRGMINYTRAYNALSTRIKIKNTFRGFGGAQMPQETVIILTKFEEFAVGEMVRSHETDEAKMYYLKNFICNKDDVRARQLFLLVKERARESA